MIAELTNQTPRLRELCEKFDVERLEVLSRFLDHIIGKARNDRIAERCVKQSDNDDRDRAVATKLFVLGV